jgi:hypothetical protein
VAGFVSVLVPVTVTILMLGFAAVLIVPIELVGVVLNTGAIEDVVEEVVLDGEEFVSGAGSSFLSQNVKKITITNATGKTNRVGFLIVYQI